MVFLLFHILFASSFTLLIKFAQQRTAVDVVTVGAINYIVAALAILPVFVTTNPTPISGVALMTGGAMGTTYFIAFFFVIYAIRTVGASSTTVVSVLSILLPISLAALWYAEYPSRGQTMGIGLALASLLLITSGKKPADRNLQKIKASRPRTPTDSDGKSSPASSTPVWVVPTVLLVFFCLCGMNRVFQDTFKHFSTGDQRPAFLIAAFTMAGIPSSVVLLRRWRVPSRSEFAIGIAMGLANVLQTFFVLRALQHLQGYIVFTLASCGAIVLTTVVATGMMGERISRRAQLGISMAVVALVLLRWLPT